MPGAVVSFGIDNFKYYNDRHGHRVGDDLLRLLADNDEIGREHV